MSTRNKFKSSSALCAASSTIACLLATPSGRLAFADTVPLAPTDSPKAATATEKIPSIAASHLPMPADFSKVVVAQLIGSIEAPRATAILKLGYFNRRGAPSFPPVDGFALLKAAIANERPGNKRWFLLQEVRGWAAFRMPQISADEGFDAYNQIFDNAKQAKVSGSSYSVATSTREFVFTAAGRSVPLGLQSDKRSNETLIKAWESYFNADGGQNTTGADPLWYEAITRMQAQGAILPFVEKSLADPQVTKSYGLLNASAKLLYSVAPARSLELLRQARPLVPKTNIIEVGRFYDFLIDLLLEVQSPASTTSADKKILAEAVSLQLERIKLTGLGRGKLGTMYIELGDWDAISKLASESSLRDVATIESNDVAQRLRLASVGSTDAGRKLQFKERSIEILKHTIQLPPVPSNVRRMPEEASQRVRAFYLLASTYAAEQKWSDAATILEKAELIEPETNRIPNSYTVRVRALLADMRKRISVASPGKPSTG